MPAYCSCARPVKQNEVELHDGMLYQILSEVNDVEAASCRVDDGATSVRISLHCVYHSMAIIVTSGVLLEKNAAYSLLLPLFREWVSAKPHKNKLSKIHISGPLDAMALLSEPFSSFISKEAGHAFFR
eukprot:3144258-Pleurochrysis_carterae.AAC.2